MTKRLYRVEEKKMIFGVCAGIAEYFNVDPTLVRLICVLLGCTGSGLLVYLIAAFIMPIKPPYIEAE